MKIIAKQFPHTAISGFQPTGLVPYFDEHTQCWTEQFGRFQRQDPPSVQIHHTGKSHWVTSLQDKKDGTVYVLDSYSKTFTLTPSLEIQLSAIYGQGKTNLLIKLPEVQQQTNGYDCGVYALANLFEFCYSGTYNTQKHTHYIERYMRSHLIACLEKGHFSPFPQSTSTNTDVVKVYTRKIESICYCGKPDVFQNMVGCEAKRGRVKCSKWVHQSCSGVSGDWFCDDIVTVDSATCIDISIVSFLNKWHVDV